MKFILFIFLSKQEQKQKKKKQNDTSTQTRVSLKNNIRKIHIGTSKDSLKYKVYMINMPKT